MKKILTGSALLLAGLLLSGCSNEEWKKGPDGDAIVLSAKEVVSAGLEVDESQQSPETKAPLNVFRNTKVRFANGSSPGDYSVHWDARISTHGRVVFIPQRTYHPSDTYHFVRGFHPVPATNAEDVTGQALQYVDYVIDGSQDIMVSSEAAVGKLTAKVRDTYVTFKHVLSQLTFNVVNDPLAPYPANNTVQDIWVEALAGNMLQNKCRLDLSTATLAFTGTESNGTPSALGLFYAFSKTHFNDEPIAVETKEKNNVAAIMFQPNIPVVIKVRYGDLNITHQKDLALNFVPKPGYSYNVTLKFTGAGVFLTNATMKRWITNPNMTGSTGNGANNPIEIW